MADKQPILSVRDIHVSFGTNHVLRGLDLDARAGEIIGFVGGSGTGKSVLMRTILGLTFKQRGSIHLFGKDYDALDDRERSFTDRRIGVLFQHGALFSALTVRENIQVPMREYLKINQNLMDELAAMKLSLVGLPPEAANKYPSELSGGMIKRASLARALALDPEIVFLDEPTSGLDPIGAADFDNLTVSLSRALGLTVFMVTHDLGSLHAICDRIAVLKAGKVLAIDRLEKIEKLDDPWIRSYFGGKRALSAQRALKTGAGMAESMVEG